MGWVVRGSAVDRRIEDVGGFKIGSDQADRSKPHRLDQLTCTGVPSCCTSSGPINPISMMLTKHHRLQRLQRSPERYAVSLGISRALVSRCRWFTSRHAEAQAFSRWIGDPVGDPFFGTRQTTGHAVSSSGRRVLMSSSGTGGGTRPRR